MSPDVRSVVSQPATDKRIVTAWPHFPLNVRVGLGHQTSLPSARERRSCCRRCRPVPGSRRPHSIVTRKRPQKALAGDGPCLSRSDAGEPHPKHAAVDSASNLVVGLAVVPRRTGGLSRTVSAGPGLHACARHSECHCVPTWPVSLAGAGHRQRASTSAAAPPPAPAAPRPRSCRATRRQAGSRTGAGSPRRTPTRPSAAPRGAIAGRVASQPGRRSSAWCTASHPASVSVIALGSIERQFCYS